MAAKTETEEKAKCQWCESENVRLEKVYEEPQYGVETEGGGVGHIYAGTDVKKHYRCNDCGKTFVKFSIKD